MTSRSSTPHGSSGDELAELAHAIRHSSRGVVALTGAGVSVASGVPSFRGRGGLWERYDPMEVATVQALREQPERVWVFLRELDDVLRAARPNAGHEALAELEELGFLRAVITQNVDSLHQQAGSREVIELHGSNRTLHCIACGDRVPRELAEERDDATVPQCTACGGVLKPDVTFFGEELPRQALRRAEHLCRSCDVLLVAGTSAEVHPASRLPGIARQHGATVWEINPVAELPDARRLVGGAEDLLPELLRRLRPGRRGEHWRQMFRGLDPRSWLE